LFYDDIVHEFGEITFKVTDFGTNRNLMYDFLLVMMVALCNRETIYIFIL